MLASYIDLLNISKVRVNSLNQKKRFLFIINQCDTSNRVLLYSTTTSTCLVFLLWSSVLIFQSLRYADDSGHIVPTSFYIMFHEGCIIQTVVLYKSNVTERGRHVSYGLLIFYFVLVFTSKAVEPDSKGWGLCLFYMALGPLYIHEERNG